MNDNPVGRPTGSTGMTENQLKKRREKLMKKLLSYSNENLDGDRWRKKNQKKDEHKRY